MPARSHVVRNADVPCKYCYVEARSLLLEQERSLSRLLGTHLLFSEAGSLACLPLIVSFTSGTLVQSLKASGTVQLWTKSLQFQCKASTSRNLPLPLHERPAIYATAAQSLETWYKAAKLQTRNAASHFSHPDDPTSEDLQRELNWLVEDAVLEGRSLSLQGCQSDNDLHLRVNLSELQSLWRQRLESRVPLQYLTNSAHWGDLVLAVGPGVLVPRPETFCLIEFAQQACSTNETLAQGSWADLGTGSGALAVGLAKALPSLKQVLAVEKSQQAREWAVMNANRLQLSSRVQVVAGSWFDPIEHMRGRLAGILSNPPYIESHVLPTLQAEVRMHEPSGALDGGASGGLECLHAICDSAAEFLIPGGFLGLEMGGPEQAEAVSRLPALQKDFVSIERWRDMYGIERFVIALRK